jgi:hypothetical protein
MKKVNAQSFLDTIVPAVYVEGIKLSDAGTLTASERSISALKRKSQFGKTEYVKEGINLGEVSQNIDGSGLTVDINMCLMLNNSTVRYMKNNQRIEIYVILTEDTVVIDRLRKGEFRFRQLNKLMADQRLIIKTIPFSSFLNSHRNTMVSFSSGPTTSTYNKLNFETSIDTFSLNPKNLACFTFMRSANRSVGSSFSFDSKNQLFGRLTGELILSNYSLQTNSYFFVSPQTDEIWAGAAHQNIVEETNKLIYMEGLKHTSTPHGILSTGKASISKIVDTRVINSDRLMSYLKNYFLLDPGAEMFKTETKTSEDIVFDIKNNGVSEIFPSISPDQKLRSIFFINRFTMLQRNSPYASLLNNLGDTTLREIINSTYMQNIKVGRVLDSDLEERELKIIDTSFAPGTNTYQISEGHNLFKTEEKRELATIRYNQNYSFRERIMPMVLTDNVSSGFSNSDFYYRMQISFRDGIREVANKKVAKFISSCYNMHYIYKILQDDSLTSKNGRFIIDRINKLELTKYSSADEIDKGIALFLANLIDVLDIFFKIEPATLNQINQAFYAQLNIHTGNIRNYENLFLFVDQLKDLLTSNLNFTTLFQDSSDGSKKTSTHKEPKDLIKINVKTRNVNVNLSSATGVKYFDTITDQGSMPTVSTTAFENRTTQEIGKYISNSNLTSQSQIIGQLVTNKYRDFTPIKINMDANEFDLLTSPNKMTSRLSSLLCTVNNRTFGNSRRSYRFGFDELHKDTRAALIHKNELLTSLTGRGISFKSEIQKNAGSQSTVESTEVMGSEETNFNTATGDLADSPELFDIQSNLNFARRMSNIVYQDILLQSLSQQRFEELLNLIDFDMNNEGSKIFSLYEASKDKKKFIDNLPLQIKVLSSPTGASLSARLSTLFNLKQVITGNKVFPYMLFNHFLIGRILYASGFESGTNIAGGEAPTPIFEPLTPAVMNTLVGGGKILCKISNYANNALLVGEYKNLNLKTIDQYFTIDAGTAGTAAGTVPDIAATNVHGLGNTASALYQDILNLKATGFYEQVLASSLFVTQPKEVLEIQYNYGSGVDLSKKKPPVVSPTQTSVPMKPSSTTRRGGYK